MQISPIIKYPSFLNRCHNHASIITVFEEPVLTLFEHNITAARRYENIKSVAILNDVYMSGQGVSIRLAFMWLEWGHSRGNC